MRIRKGIIFLALVDLQGGFIHGAPIPTFCDSEGVCDPPLQADVPKLNNLFRRADSPKGNVPAGSESNHNPPSNSPPQPAPLDTASSPHGTTPAGSSTGPGTSTSATLHPVDDDRGRDGSDGQPKHIRFSEVIVTPKIKPTPRNGHRFRKVGGIQGKKREGSTQAKSDRAPEPPPVEPVTRPVPTTTKDSQRTGFEHPPPGHTSGKYDAFTGAWDCRD